jgi:hypothetical protein
VSRLLDLPPKILRNQTDRSVAIITCRQADLRRLRVGDRPPVMAALHRDGVAYRPFCNPMPKIETVAVWRKKRNDAVVRKLIGMLDRPVKRIEVDLR